MDWSNERYVRLYVRDTTTWKRLGWDGQSVLMHLIRKVDRAGTLDLSELEPWEAIMLVTGAPEDVAKRGLEALLRTRTVGITCGRLVFPGYIEAQECTKSDKQRQRESRERRAAPGQAFNTLRDSESPLPAASASADSSVTNRDSVGSRNVTDPSRPVTTGHEQSQPVTFGHSVLCSAVPSSEETTPPAGAHDAGARVEMRAPEPANDVRPPVDVMGLQLALGKAAGELDWETAPEVMPSQLARAARRIPGLAKCRGLRPDEAAHALARAALLRSRATGQGVGFALLEVDPAQPVPKSRGRPRMAAATTHEDYADAEPLEMQLARLREDHG